MDMVDRCSCVFVDVFCGCADTCYDTNIRLWEKNVYRTAAMHILKYL